MCLRYPCPDRFTRRRGNFELNRPLRFLLHDCRRSRDLIAMAYITYLQLEQVTATKLAVDAKIEQRQFTRSVPELQPHSDCPDVFQPKGAFCPTIFPLFQGVGRSLPLAFEIMMTSLLR